MYIAIMLQREFKKTVSGLVSPAFWVFFRKALTP